MKTSLFDDNDGYTDVARQLEQQVHPTIINALRYIVDKGYSIRDAAHIIGGVVRDAECEVILEQGVREARKQP